MSQHNHAVRPALLLAIPLSLLLAALSLVGTSADLPGSGQPVYWYSSNAGLPSDVEALATAPLSPTVLFAGTWGQGVYRSTDQGVTWQVANQGIRLPMAVQGALTVNPVTPSIIYAGDYYGGGLYRSMDGGDSWTLSLADAAVRAVAVDPLSPTVVLAGDREQGLYRSADGGDTWMPITATAGFTETQVRTLAFAPTAPHTTYAGALQTVFSSADAGQSWMARGTLPSTIQSLVVHPITPTLLYAGTFAHGLYRSSDGGATWTPLGGGLPPGEWITSLAVAPGPPVTLYAGAWSGQVYRSPDGETWEGLGYLGYVYAVLIHPAAPSVIYAGTSNNGVFRGSTLDRLTMEPVESPQQVGVAFPITVTACDELGFPLTGPLQRELAAITEYDPALAETLAAGGYNGTAVLADTTGTVYPVLIGFDDGVAMADVAIAVPITSDILTATVPEGPWVTSNPFDVIGRFRVYLPFILKSE